MFQISFWQNEVYNDFIITRSIMALSLRCFSSSSMAFMKVTLFLQFHHHKFKNKRDIHIQIFINAPVTARGDSVHPHSYACLLQECRNIKSVQQVHANILIHGYDQNLLLGTRLVNSYAMCGSLANARLVFDKISAPNIFLWNAIVREYAKTENAGSRETLELYYQMQESGIEPNNFTFPFILKACACGGPLALQEGKEIHDRIARTGFEYDVHVGAALIDMYSKCGSINDARQAFYKMSGTDVVLWNAMISGLVQNGYPNEALNLFNQMQYAKIKPVAVTIVNALSGCAQIGALHHGKCIHTVIIRCGLESNVFVGTALVDMYAKSGNVKDGGRVFDEMPQRNVVSWTAVISGYAQNGHANEALTLFHQMMQQALVIPNAVTLTCVLSACAQLGDLQQGKWIHDYIRANGFQSNIFVGTALIDMYGKCGDIENAHKLFGQTPGKNVVSWNAMIAGYVENKRAIEALTLFSQMQSSDIKPNSVTMLSLLSACSYLGDIQYCKMIHDYLLRNGLDSDASIGNSLVDVYAKCGNLKFARLLFDRMSERDVVSWTAIIVGYAQNGYANEALTLFHQMQLASVTPDSITLASVVMACAQIRSLQQGKWIHDYIVRYGFESDVSVGNSLVAMYAKCGSIEIAHELFNRMCERDIISWTAMIVGYSQNGQANEALTLFNQMQLVDMTPDPITIVNILSVYSNLAALQQGKRIHNYIIRNGFESDVSVVSALVNMYAKCGSIKIARLLFDNMPKRDVISWNAIIAGYGLHGCGEEALVLFHQMEKTSVKPDHVTFVSVLSACSHAGLVDDGWQCFDSMSQVHRITPGADHFACMVDLLGRAGRLDEAQDFIKQLPLKPDAAVWGALLGACRIHSNIELGECAAGHLLNLEPENAGYYVLLSNMYAAAGKWNKVAQVRIMMKERRTKKTPGYSLIEVDNNVHAFLVGDRSQPHSEKIYATLETLAG